jgi:hypothetical protein
MAISLPPPPKKKKKSGLGCLGCGCLIVAVILLLFGALVGGLGYMGYKEAVLVTSTAPAAFAPYNGSDDIYAGAQKKLETFNEAVGTGNPGSLTLNADEINAEFAHDQALSRYHARLLVSMQGDQARFQFSMPTDAFFLGLLKGRYVNLDVTFGINFADDSKNIVFDLHQAQIGDITLPTTALPGLDANLTQVANQQFRKIPAVSNVIDVAKTIEIKDGQLVIETK